MKTIAEQSEEGTEKALTKFQQWCKDTFGDGKDLAALKAQLAQLTADLATAKQSIQTLTEQHATALAAKETEITTLKATHAAELQTAKNGATAALAKVNVVPIPETGTGTGTDAKAKTRREEYAAITDHEAAAKFYAEHKDAILKGQ